MFEAWSRPEKRASGPGEGIPMHTENELHNYLYRSGYNLSLTTIDYIRQSWINPSRMVGAYAQSNVVSFVPSRKLNGKTYSTE